jgi:hypothetical protein
MLCIFWRLDYVALAQIPYYIETQGALRPYWEGMNQGEFRTTKCKKCQEMHFPPRVLCPKCYSTHLEWVSLPLTGTLQTGTMVSVPPQGFQGQYYLASVLVDVLNKPILGRLNAHREAKIGDRVQLRFEAVGSQAVIVFQLT